MPREPRAAEVGDRSPFSRTSIGWSDAPVKPELVLEAGNRALSPSATELEKTDYLVEGVVGNIPKS